MGWSSVWKLVKKTAEKVFIAVSSYQIGESQNDADKITDAIVKVNERIVANQVHQEDNLFQYLACGAVIIVVIAVLVTIVGLVKYMSARAVRNDRRIRNLGVNNNE